MLLFVLVLAVVEVVDVIVVFFFNVFPAGPKQAPNHVLPIQRVVLCVVVLVDNSVCGFVLWLALK